jgi:hypothetical protein
MIGTNLPRKRSEHGASLILLVSIIGVAFIVTVAAMLVAASYSQDRARLASAKVDVANREDVLMREILRETATGLAPGTDTKGVTASPASWTSIMTTAATNLHAISYVDQGELQTLGITGVTTPKVTTANLGDSGGGNPLDIFQGCTLVPHSADVPWSEVPFGGTSGLANCVPNLAVDHNNNVIDPPLMNWSGNTTLVSATAATTPQEFFLGSLNTAGNRWAQLYYPNIRFGYKYKQPGDPNPLFLVARRVWWRIPVVYKPAQPTAEYQVGTDPASANSYPSAQANYVLSVYEIPSQLPISGNANLQIGAWDPTKISVTGSISGNQITLSGGPYSGGVSSRQKVYVVNPAIVGGVAYSSDSTGSAFDQPGTQPGSREEIALTQTPGAAAPVSVVRNDGKVLLVPVMPGNDFYIPAPPAPGAPTHWDLYARPYYRCRIRVIISGTDSTIIYNPNQTPTTNTAAGAITVKIFVLPDLSSSPDQILGFRDSAATPQTFTQTSIASPNPNLALYGMKYTSTAAGDRNILVIDVLKLVQALGNPAQLYSIYIGNPPNPPDPPSGPYNNPGIAITDTHDLSAFTSGLSIVTNQTLYLLDRFNQGKKDGTGLLVPGSVVPTSLYAPDVRYGISALNLQVNLTGQVAVVATPAPAPSPTPVNPLSFTSGNGGSIASSNTSATLTELTDPTKIPPITALNLLFTIEKEHTN